MKPREATPIIGDHDGPELPRLHHNSTVPQSIYMDRHVVKPIEPCETLSSLANGTFHRIYLPPTIWLRHYRPPDLLWDLNAGLVVGVMLIPQGMAYALLAGCSPIFGLFCAIVPNVTYALLGTSHESAVGAMALVSMMVGNAISTLVADRDNLQLRELMAVRFGFVVGFLQVVFGFIKLGRIANYVSHPVMVGFCSAGEILIAVSQLKYLLGIKVPSFVYAYETLGYILTHLDETSLLTVLLGTSSFCFLFAISRWRRKTARLAPRDPLLDDDAAIRKARRIRILRLLCNFAPFVVIILTSVASYIIIKHGHEVAVIGKVPQGLRMFKPYDMSPAELQALVPQSVILAVISFMLTYSVSKKYANVNHYEVDSSQELVALGAANTFGSLFGSFPVAGGFSRTAVNVEAGAKSQVSALVSAGLILTAVNCLTSTFYYIPMSSLAAIVQVAICGVVDFSPFFFAYHASKSEFLIMLVTFVTTLVFGVDKGIMAGVALHIIVLLKNQSAPQIKVLGRVAGTKVFRDVMRYPDAEQYPGIKIVRLDESITFASCMAFKEKLLSATILGGLDPPRHVVLEASGVNYVDLSGLQVLKDVEEELERRGITLHMVNCKGTVRDTIKDSTLAGKLGDELYLSLCMLLTTLLDDGCSELQELATLADSKSDSDEDEERGLQQGPEGTNLYTNYLMEPEFYI